MSVGEETDRCTKGDRALKAFVQTRKIPQIFYFGTVETNGTQERGSLESVETAKLLQFPLQAWSTRQKRTETDVKRTATAVLFAVSSTKRGARGPLPTVSSNVPLRRCRLLIS